MGGEREPDLLRRWSSRRVAVTSIPVISRIMHDLGLLRTGFARVVLGVAVVEDVILYVVLAVAVDLATPSGPATGLPAGARTGGRVDRGHRLPPATTVGLLRCCSRRSRVNSGSASHPG